MKKLLVQFLTKNLFRWVSEEDILEVRGKNIFHKGRPLPEEQTIQIVEQANLIRKSYLWKVLSDEIRFVAYLQFVQSRNYEETLSAKLLLRAEEIIRKKVEELGMLNRLE